MTQKLQENFSCTNLHQIVLFTFPSDKNAVALSKSPKYKNTNCEKMAVRKF